MKRFLSILCLLLIAANAFADRSKVGVVLCGGGAKGAAHVGVLKVLEENDIPIDFIVGTSMGSIIGGLYAIGYTADELDTLIMSQDWTLMMSDRIERDKLAFEKKRFDDEYVVKVPFGFDDYSRLAKTKDEDVPVLANIPMAMVNGQNLYNLFTKLSVGYQDSLDFNKMPIPFACVAVDLVKKEEYVFHSGRFVDAIRSSMAIPGYFAPMRLGDRVLVDGGVLNNFPVDVAREMGADIIIGVNLSDPFNEEPTISNIGDIFNELLNLVRKDKEKAALESTDILIVPDKGELSTFSFDTASLRKLIDSGEAAARDKQQELAELKERIDAENYLFEESFVGPVKAPVTYKKAVHLDKDTITVGRVIVNGLDPDDARYLLEKSCFQPAARLNGAMIDAEITRLYNTDAFESVTYLLKGTEEPYDLELNFTGNRRSVLGLGFRFDLEEIASILLKVGLNKNSLYGSQLSFSAKLAYNMQTNLEYAYVFRSLAQFNLGYKTRYSNLNTFNPDAKGNLIFLERSLYAGFSTKRFRNVHTNFGVQMDFFDYKSYISGSDILPIYNPDLANDVFASGYLNFEIDKRDDYYYPTKGFNFSAGYNYYISSLFGQTANNFGALKTHLSAVASAGNRVSVIISGDNRTLFGGNIPMAYMNIMGGTQQGRYMDQQLPFIGFNYTNVFSNILSVATIDVRTRVMDNHYLFASASLAHDCTDISSFFEGSTVFGTRLGYSYNSAIGPIALFANWSDYNKSVGMGFSIGYTF